MENSFFPQETASSENAALNSFRNPVLIIIFFVMIVSFLSMYSESLHLETKDIHPSHNRTAEKIAAPTIKNAYHSKD